MITRPKVRRCACWAGAGLGAACLLALGASAIVSISILNDPCRVVILGRGSLGVYWQERTFSLPNGSPLPMSAPGGTMWRWLPKWRETGVASMGSYSRETPGEFVLPLWVPGVFGLWCLYRLLPERGPLGACGKCGYDVRAVPAKNGQVVCPECGMAAA